MVKGATSVAEGHSIHLDIADDYNRYLFVSLCAKGRMSMFMRLHRAEQLPWLGTFPFRRISLRKVLLSRHLFETVCFLWEFQVLQVQTSSKFSWLTSWMPTFRFSAGLSQT